jgi:hypothetical protein
MLLDSNPPQFFAILDEIKFFVALGGGFWALFSAYQWVKSNLTQTHTELTKLNNGLSDQTTAIVHATEANTTQVKELRDDVKQMIQAWMAPPPVRSRAARRKK